MEKYKLIQGVNDVKTLYPELMVDWDYDNNTRNPESLLSNSNYDANWYVIGVVIGGNQG